MNFSASYIGWHPCPVHINIFDRRYTTYFWLFCSAAANKFGLLKGRPYGAYYMRNQYALLLWLSAVMNICCHHIRSYGIVISSFAYWMEMIIVLCYLMICLTPRLTLDSCENIKQTSQAVIIFILTWNILGSTTVNKMLTFLFTVSTLFIKVVPVSNQAAYLFISKLMKYFPSLVNN